MTPLLTRTRWARTATAVALFAASLAMLWLAFFPSGLGTMFGDDEFDPLSGLVFVGLSALGSVGIVRWSRLRWIGIGLATLSVPFWVLFVLNTTPAGPSPLLAALYLVAPASLLVATVLQRRAPNH